MTGVQIPGPDSRLSFPTKTCLFRIVLDVLCELGAVIGKNDLMIILAHRCWLPGGVCDRDALQRLSDLEWVSRARFGDGRNCHLNCGTAIAKDEVEVELLAEILHPNVEFLIVCFHSHVIMH